MALSTYACPLRSLLGLSGYHRKFIKNYAIISTPFTIPLCQIIGALKEALSESSVLALPDFEIKLFIECNALDSSIGVVLE